MIKPLLSLLLTSVIALLIAGCATQPLETGPSNIRGVKEFTLEPVKFEDLVVDDMKEEDFKAKKAPDQLRSWGEDRDAIKARFAVALTETAARSGITISDSSAGQHYTIRPVITKIDTGYYRIPAWNAVTRIYMRITILDPSGKNVDETTAEGSKSFDAIGAPDSGGRLKSSANELGEKYAKYLEKRTHS